MNPNKNRHGRKLPKEARKYQSQAKVQVTSNLKARPDAEKSLPVSEELTKVNKSVAALGTFGREKAGDTVKTTTVQSDYMEATDLSVLREITHTTTAEAIAEEVDKVTSYQDESGNIVSVKDAIIMRSQFEEHNEKYYGINNQMAVRAGLRTPDGQLIPKDRRGKYSDAEVEQLKENWKKIKVLTGFDLQFKIRFEHYVLESDYEVPANDALLKKIDGYSNENAMKLGAHTMTITLPVQNLEQIPLIKRTVEKFVINNFMSLIK